MGGASNIPKRIIFQHLLNTFRLYIYIYIIYIESLMSCHLLLNLLHELANMILCEALPSIISFLPTNVINLVINDNEFEILFIT